MNNFERMIIYYFIAYFVVTSIGVFHTIFNIKVLKMKSMKESAGMGEGYEKTKPYHILYNIIIFPIFSYLYFNGLETTTLSNVILTSFSFTIITVVLDLVGWVLIKHPYSLTFKQFYIDYQPYITLIYIAICISPFITYGIMNLLNG